MNLIMIPCQFFTNETSYFIRLTDPELTYRIQIQAIDKFKKESIQIKPLEIKRPKGQVPKFFACA